MSTPSDFSIPGRPERPRGIIEGMADRVADIGALVIDVMTEVGNFATFSWRMFVWLLTRLPSRETLTPNFYQIGVLSQFQGKPR